MKETTAASLLFLALFTSEARTEDATSGLQPGDLARPFEVIDVTGPNKGVALCYR